MTEHPYFPGDTYRTPPDHPRDLADRLCFGGSAWFYARIAQVVLDGRAKAIAGRYDRAAWSGSSRRVLDALEGCGARVQVEGLDNLRAVGGPAVLIGNHMSTMETMVLPALVDPILPVTFVVKDSLVRMPVFGTLLRARAPITVGRASARQDMQTVLEEGCARLADGVSVIIFPQSTRQSRFDPEQFNSLGVKLARRAGVPVVPVAVRTDFWTNGKLVKDLGPLVRSRPVHFRFGAPLRVTGGGKDEHQAVVDFICDSLREWGLPVP